jgi:hypothetical protein
VVNGPPEEDIPRPQSNSSIYSDQDNFLRTSSVRSSDALSARMASYSAGEMPFSLRARTPPARTSAELQAEFEAENYDPEELRRPSPSEKRRDRLMSFRHHMEELAGPSAGTADSKALGNQGSKPF